MAAGCGSPTAAPAASTNGLQVIPASSHVTGHYPASCVRPAGADPQLPDAACTPGSIRSDVTQASIGQTICVRGWTATVRPPASETGPVKTQAMRSYGVPASERPIVELDHLVPIELGGANDVSNLWPEISDEPGHGFNNSKDGLENRMKIAVCSHRMSLADAQRAIALDWRMVAVP